MSPLSDPKTSHHRRTKLAVCLMPFVDLSMRKRGEMPVRGPSFRVEREGCSWQTTGYSKGKESKAKWGCVLGTWRHPCRQAYSRSTL